MMSKMMIAMVAGAAAFMDCGNGFGCSTGFCTSTTQGSGALFGCTPAKLDSDAVVCSDRRFSCRKGDECALSYGLCISPNKTTSPLYLNEKAEINSKMLRADTSVCGIIAPDLPSYCLCVDSTTTLALGGNVTCEIDVLGLDNIILIADIEPCVDPMHIDFLVQETAIGFQFAYNASAANITQEIDTGLGINIPNVGSAEVYVAVFLDGTVSNLNIKLGIDVCATLPIVGTKCGHKLIKQLPIWALDANFTLTDVCNPPPIK